MYKRGNEEINWTLFLESFTGETWLCIGCTFLGLWILITCILYISNQVYLHTLDVGIKTKISKSFFFRVVWNNRPKGSIHLEKLLGFYVCFSFGHFISKRTNIELDAHCFLGYFFSWIYNSQFIPKLYR